MVYGPTTEPKEVIFKNLVDQFHWDMLDLDDYSLIEVPSHQRGLDRYVKEVVSFLQEWIKNSTKKTLRHDYLELATLTLISWWNYV